MGVQAAAETYFSKPVQELDLPEAALIAGLPQAPSEYNPFLNPKGAEAATQRRAPGDGQAGIHHPEDYEQALQAGLGLDRGHKYETIREPYFFDYVTQELIDKYGVNTVRNGGLKVHTTIDPRLQAAAQQAIANHAILRPARPGRWSRSTPPTATSSRWPRRRPTLRPHQFNLAANAHRQAGSSFKPFVLTAAVRQGMDPDSTYYSGKAPVTLTLDDGITNWTVNNAEGSGGTMSVRDATVGSVNAVYAQLDLDVGPEEVRDTAYDMGITTHLDGFPAEGIGGLRIGVTPLEMANAYATLANGGIRNTATAISKVEFPNGDTDVPEEAERTRAFSDGVAYEVTDVLKGVITSGTAAGPGHLRRRGRGGQDGDHRRLHGRLVRRLHAAVLDRRLGRLRRREDIDGLGRLRRRLCRPDLARLHAGRAGQRLPRLPGAREPGRVLDLDRVPHRQRSRPPRRSYGPTPGGRPRSGSTDGAGPGSGVHRWRPVPARPVRARCRGRPRAHPGRGRRRLATVAEAAPAAEGAPGARARPEAQPA